MNDIFLGIDVGSATAKVVVLDRAKNLLAHTYLRANGRPRHTLLQATEILAPLADARIAAGERSPQSSWTTRLHGRA